MMTERENKIGFSLLNITTEQFAEIDESFKENESVQLSLGFSFEVDDEKKLISIFFNIKFTQNQNPFLILETGCHFEISSDTWNNFFDKDPNKIIIPKGFAGHLLMLNIGTSRGVLHCKTENTIFSKFLLPTINVNSLIEEDIVCKISENKKLSNKI